jgi:hypothetical protein
MATWSGVSPEQMLAYIREARALRNPNKISEGN